MSETDDLTYLLATEHIRTLKARYFRMLDTKDWDGFADVFTAEAVLDADPFVITGASAIADAVRGALTGLVTVHHGHTAEIVVDSADRAHAIWAMSDFLYGGGEPESGLAGAGHYHEHYVRTDDGWRINRLRLDRLHVAPLLGGYQSTYLETR